MATPKRLLDKKQIEYLTFLQQNPDVAASDLLRLRNRPVMLNWYQRKFLREFWNKQFGLLVWSRAAGKTVILAIYTLLRALFYPSHKVVIVAGSYRQAQNVFKVIEDIYHESIFLQQACVKPPSFTPIRCELKFKHGSVISALPLGDGLKIRGERAQTLVVDEALAVPKEIVDVVLRPMLNAPSDPWSVSDVRNSLLLSSTAYYQFNYIYEMYDTFKKKINQNSDEYDPSYHLSVINILDMPRGWIDVNQVNSQRYTMPKIKWLMENMSVFASDSDGYYSASVVEQCKSSNVKIELEGDKNAKYVMGIDPARYGANFAVAILKLGEPYHSFVYAKTLYRKTSQEQDLLIRQLCDKFNIVWIVMDQGGGGIYLKDILKEERKHFDLDSNHWKTYEPILDYSERTDTVGKQILNVKQCQDKDNTEMNEFLKALFENKGLLIPNRIPDDPKEEEVYYEIEETINELLDIRATPNKTGYFNFHTSSKSQKKDRYSALLLAAHGAKEYLSKFTNKRFTGEEIRGLVLEGVPWLSSVTF